MRGWCRALTPPHSAMSVSPPRSACTARCSATSEEEQAVSTLMLGPPQPRKYDSRPETADRFRRSRPARAPALPPYAAWSDSSSFLDGLGQVVHEMVDRRLVEEHADVDRQIQELLQALPYLGQPQ